jgi:hypothetical protein
MGNGNAVRNKGAFLKLQQMSAIQPVTLHNPPQVIYTQSYWRPRGFTCYARFLLVSLSFVYHLYGNVDFVGKGCLLCKVLFHVNIPGAKFTQTVVG